MAKFPPKPPAPSVHVTIGTAIERSRALAKDERPMSQRDLVREMLSKLEMPAALKARLRGRYRIND